MPKQQGFVMIGLVGVLVVTLVVAAGYLLYQSMQSSSTSDNSPTTYQSNDDLDKGLDEIEKTDVDASLDASLTELDQEAAQF